MNIWAQTTEFCYTDYSLQLNALISVVSLFFFILPTSQIKMGFYSNFGMQKKQTQKLNRIYKKMKEKNVRFL